MITKINFYDTASDIETYATCLAKLGIAQQAGEEAKKVLEEYDFRVDVPVTVYASTSGVHISFSIPEDVTEEQQHFLIADIVRAFGVRLERKFSESYGKFYFTGTLKELAYGMTAYIDVSGVKAKNCKIVAITELKPVTRYVSDCSGGGEAGVEPQPVGETVNE